MSRWFRFYDGTLDDPKVQKLPDALFRTWVNLLCLASRHNGSLPNLEDMAFSLRTSEEAMRDGLEALVSRGLLDCEDGEMSPHNWHERQYKSDGSADRMRSKRARDRERHGDKIGDAGSDVTGDTSGDDPSDTLEQNRTESDTERTIVRSSKPPAPKRRSGEDPPGFAEWYAAFPRREGRGAARRAYATALQKADAPTLLAGACVAARRYSGSDPKFIPHPATWLNGERWLDEAKRDPPSGGMKTAI